ncbi:MAG: aminopeptidase P N-terminal domain-containing protein [Acholeplasmatales bacterium]|nr:aminopeptidase P N-terminal domain-containing protein [Acholeplasmatales bacterium]
MESYVFKNNRKKITDQMLDDSFLVVFSRMDGSDDIFKQSYNINRNFYYLTGVLEFENIVVLTKLNGKVGETIFINPYDEFKAKWVGAPLSKEEITKLSGIENVRYLADFESYLDRMLQVTGAIYLDLKPTGLNSALSEEELLAKKIKDKFPSTSVVNARKLFTKARTIKQPEEIEEMRKAIEITNKGLQSIMSHMGEMKEYQLESYFDQAVKYNGGTGYAFPTIAAAGKNACCLHYMENKGDIKNGDLILFDLGSSYNMYCSDISRTYPVSGKFSERQKLLYNIVLNGQQLVFDNAKPGITTRELNQILVKYYQVELKKIGLIEKPEEVSKYYYHGVSHHIGLDCHDLCEYTPLQPGSIISNEPGLYIEEEGIGIRIEDDILITENGAEWLSKDIIKTVEDIEKYMGEKHE